MRHFAWLACFALLSCGTDGTSGLNLVVKYGGNGALKRVEALQIKVIDSSGAPSQPAIYPMVPSGTFDLDATGMTLQLGFPAGKMGPVTIHVDALSVGTPGDLGILASGETSGVMLQPGAIAMAPVIVTLTIKSPPNCSEGDRNGDETDKDCGGTCATTMMKTCADGLHCEVGPDCTDGVCTDFKCAPPTCGDMVKNGDETDVDCGGSCVKTDHKQCDVGQGCAVTGPNGDCKSGVCDMTKHVCSSASCMDGVLNGNETDVDCGGSCPGCLDGKKCLVGGDCLSKVCSGGKCQKPTCSDLVQNGNETDVDCGGGTCGPCADGKKCMATTDCMSLDCKNMVCAAATCSDGIKNQNETATDCGGVCDAQNKLCADGQACKTNADCQSDHCSNGTCISASCTDGVKNGQETDIDCGGTMCAPCGTGKMCLVKTDCQSMVCTGSICQAPTCSDMVLNGSETDVDCGGSVCATTAMMKFCAVGKMCKVSSDCVTTADCVNGICKSKLGQTCSSGSTCASGNCVDSTCCDTAPSSCTGCYACNNSTGTCKPVASGMDHLSTCTNLNKTNGCYGTTCNGTGSCTINVGSTTPCMPAACNNGTSGGSITSYACNMSAMCASSMTACGSANSGFACATATTCNTACGGDSQCVANYFCDVPSRTCIPLDLAAPTNISVDTHPVGLVTFDANGDGTPDLATANSMARNVTVILGDGSGGAKSKASYNTYGSSDQPSAITDGDYNKDGWPDIAIASSNSTSVNAWLNNKNGTFGSAKPSVMAGNQPEGIATADFDGDGKLDLMVTDAANSQATWFQGLGAGLFDGSTTINIDGAAWGVAAGQLDTSGTPPDFVTSDYTRNKVSVVLVSSIATMSATVNDKAYAVGTMPKGLVLADVNGDSALDIVVANSGSNNVTVLLNNGSGGFGTSNSFNVGNTPVAVAVGVLTSSMKPDIVVANQGDNTVTVLHGDGTGTVFDQGHAYAVGASPSAVVVADFNGDKALDVAVANAGDNNVSLLLHR